MDEPKNDAPVSADTRSLHAQAAKLPWQCPVLTDFGDLSGVTKSATINPGDALSSNS